MNRIQLSMRQIPQHIKTIIKLLSSNASAKLTSRLIPKTINNIEQLDDLLNDENQLSQSLELIFHYRLFGFRKAGTEHFDEHIQLRFEMNTYWYGFTLMNQNDNQPFLKKLYHQTMSEDDKHFIEDILTAKIFDRVDWIVDYIASKKQPQ